MSLTSSHQSGLHGSLRGGLSVRPEFANRPDFSRTLYRDVNTGTGISAATFARASAQIAEKDGSLVSYASGVPAFGDNGFAGQPQRTNKCTNYNANPDAGLSSMFKSGDAAATLTRVLDTTELASAGLSNVCSSGYVFKLDNTGGSANAFAVVGGQTTNTNTHTLSAYVRSTGGGGDIRNNTGMFFTAFGLTSSYTKITATGTPSASTNQLTVTSGAGSVVYFILNQLEESTFCTSPIVTEGAAATRLAPDLSYPVSGNLPVNDFVIKFNVTKYAAGQGAVNVFGCYTDANNSLELIVDDTNVTFRKQIATVNNDAVEALADVAGTTYTVKARLSSTNGVDVWVDGVKGTNDATTTDAVLASNFFIGSDGNSANYLSGQVKNFKIYTGDLTDAQVVAL